MDRPEFIDMILKEENYFDKKIIEDNYIDKPIKKIRLKNCKENSCDNTLDINNKEIHNIKWFVNEKNSCRIDAFLTLFILCFYPHLDSHLLKKYIEICLSLW